MGNPINSEQVKLYMKERKAGKSQETAAATSLRLGAHALYRSQSYLGHFYRRTRARHGSPKAITATAHKLARIVFYLIKTGKTYDETVFADQEKLHRQRLQENLKSKLSFWDFNLLHVMRNICYL